MVRWLEDDYLCTSELSCSRVSLRFGVRHLNDYNHLFGYTKLARAEKGGESL